MKKILLLASAFALTLSVMAQPKPEDVIKVNTEKHDFGKIKAGTPVTYSFEIKNTSDKPVVVETTTASCGCTTPEKIVDPIMPGKTALLKVQYNAAAVAPFTKDVHIKLAGIDATKTVQITGEVLSAEAYEEYVKTKKTKG
jgi:activator of HSP90 ATPase